MTKKSHFGEVAFLIYKSLMLPLLYCVLNESIRSNEVAGAMEKIDQKKR